MEVSLAAAAMVAGSFKVQAEDVELDAELIDLIVEVLIMLDLPADRPIPHVSDSVVKKLELIGGSNE